MVERPRMDLEKSMNMKPETYKTIIAKGIISNETEFEKALMYDRKLRVMGKENDSFKEDRKQLRQIIKTYERKHWGDESAITDKQIKESDLAEFLADAERLFAMKRKHAIKEKLATLGLTQKDLSEILGHNVTYMSELMNGLCPFTIKDLIVIHRLFKIKLEQLVPTTIPDKERARIKASIEKLNKPKLRLNKRDLELH